MANTLTLFEGKPPCPLTAGDVRRQGFGDRALFSVMVAEIERRAEGYALFYPGFDVESASRGLHMADLFVEAPFRRQGIGRALIASLVAECKRQGGQWIEWHSMTDNPTAIAFYERIGAKRDPLIPFRLGRTALARW